MCTTPQQQPCNQASWPCPSGRHMAAVLEPAGCQKDSQTAAPNAYFEQLRRSSPVFPPCTALAEHVCLTSRYIPKSSQAWSLYMCLDDAEIRQLCICTFRKFALTQAAVPLCRFLLMHTHMHRSCSEEDRCICQCMVLSITMSMTCNAAALRSLHTLLPLHLRLAQRCKTPKCKFVKQTCKLLPSLQCQQPGVS